MIRNNTLKGEKCEKKNIMCRSNPCKNEGTCRLDDNNKEVCTCTNGWSSEHCDKSSIQINLPIIPAIM